MKHTCRICNCEKQSTDFPKDSSYKSGRSNRCKLCQKTLSKDHYKKNKDQYRSNRKTTRSKRINLIKSIKVLGCSICNEKFPDCIEFHHLMNKVDNISLLIRTASLEDVFKEMNKCILVCSNCHKKIHGNVIHCPEDKKLNLKMNDWIS